MAPVSLRLAFLSSPLDVLNVIDTVSSALGIICCAAVGPSVGATRSDLTTNVRTHAMAQTTVSPGTPSEQPTRRGLLGILATGGMAASAGAMATAAPATIDPHPAWEAEMLQNDAFARSDNPLWMALPDEQAQAHMDRYQELQTRMFRTPPLTLWGAAAVVRSCVYFVEEIGCELGDEQLVALQRVAALVDRFAGARA